MNAYKWLGRNGEDPLLEVDWSASEPGQWVRMRKRFRREPLAGAVLRERLAADVHPQLWEIELEGVEKRGDHLLANRGRLLRRISAWTPALASEFGAMCAERGDAFARRALVLTSEVWRPRLDVEELIGHEAGRNLMDRIKSPSGLEELVGPSPPLKGQGMDLMATEMAGNPRQLMPQVEAAFDAYAHDHAEAGVFWLALETVQHVRDAERLLSRQDDSDSGYDEFGQAQIRSEAARLARRDLAMTELFRHFPGAGASHGSWYDVMDSSRNEEVTEQSHWLASRLGL